MSTGVSNQQVNADVVIVGAGFAGAAASYHIAQRAAQKGMRGIILEQETQGGMHASGQNAGIFRHVVKDPAIFALAKRSRSIISQSAGQVPQMVNSIGGLLLGSNQQLEEFNYLVGELEIERWPRQQVLEKFSFLEQARFDGALWSPQDGIVDTPTLLNFFLQGAVAQGFTLQLNSKVEEAYVNGDEVCLYTNQNEVRTKCVVNAAGAWAADLGQRLGSNAKLTPYKRHMFALERPTWLPEEAPFIWNLADDYYFRHADEGLWVSVCDATPTGAGDEQPMLGCEELLTDKLAQCLPLLSDLRIKRAWAGQRTFTPDKRPKVGWDEKLPWLYWLAGLGGSGVAISAALGEDAAQAISARLAS